MSAVFGMYLCKQGEFYLSIFVMDIISVQDCLSVCNFIFIKYKCKTFLLLSALRCYVLLFNVIIIFYLPQTLN